MLKKIEVKGFKSIKEMTLELKPLNIMIGINGSGKSNFISLFKMINKMSENNLQSFIGKSGGVDFLLHFGQKTTKELFVKLDMENNSYQFSLMPTLNNTLIFSNEVCQFSGKKLRTLRLGGGHRETKLYEETQKGKNMASYIFNAIKSWKVYHFEDTSETASVKQTHNIDDNRFLQPDASNLAPYLFLIREKYPQSYKNIVETIQMVAPFFSDFALRFNPINDKIMQLEWKEKGSGDYFNAHYFSDGTLRFICLATLLLQPELPSTILIDEPELGLHPFAINLLAGLIKSAASKTQVIIATQSVTLVNQFKPDDIIVVEKPDEQSVFKRLNKKDTENWLEEYGVGDLWEKNVIGGRP